MEYVYQVLELLQQWTLPFSIYLGFAQKQDYEEIFYQRLLEGNYDEALRLACSHKSLDRDMVYKCKWRNSEHTSHFIKTVLTEIEDKLWAINECVHVVPTTFEACSSLLEHGLQQSNLRLLYMLGNETVKNDRDKINTHTCLSEDTPDDDIIGLIDFKALNEQQKELCRFRRQLLRHWHSLLIYERILGDPKSIRQHFDHLFYAEFRYKSPFEASIEFARNSDCRAVTAMFNHCTEHINEHLLPILSNFPETLSPYQYRDLLPYCNKNDIYEWKGTKLMQDTDWCERFIELDKEFRDLTNDYTEEFYELHPNLANYRRPLTSDVLTEWFIERALEIECKTLLISNAIQLLELGKHLNVPDLEKTHDELDEFHKIIYDCCTEDYLDMSLSRFKQMSNLDRLLMIIGDNNANINEKLRYYIIPYICRREIELGLDGKIQLVKELFHKLAHFREQTCRNLYKTLLDQIECDDRVAEWTKDLDDAIDQIGADIQRIEKDRQANSINNLATKTLKMGDFKACYEACKLIMDQKYSSCWPVCSSLALNNKFKDYDAKCKLLAFALLHCKDQDGERTSKMLNYIIELRKRDEKLQRVYLELMMSELG